MPETADVLVLRRFAYTPMAVFGRMTVAGKELFTLEEPWRDNAVGNSCIPCGVYKCVPRQYNKHNYLAIHVTGVPGRDLVLFHIGNTTDDVDGCIAPGMGLGVVHDKWAVAASTAAFGHLMSHYGGKEFILVVTNQDHPITIQQ